MVFVESTRTNFQVTNVTFFLEIRLCRNVRKRNTLASQSPSLYPGLHMLTNCYSVSHNVYILKRLAYR